MKLFAIKSDSTGDKALGYLLYYEKAKQFYIELPDNADEWETPLLLSSFVKRGKLSVDPYWSLEWVRQRIIPPDRQNIGSILRDNRLSEYDEYKLLVLAKGRCAQDDCYIEPFDEEELPAEIKQRLHYRVEEIVPIEDGEMLVFFRDGSLKRCDVKPLSRDKRFLPVMNDPALFSAARVQTDGCGITWGENLNIDSRTLYDNGIGIPLSLSEFKSFACSCIVDTDEAAKLLDCSRQNVSDLVKRGKLHPLRTSASGYLFLLSEIRQRLWQ